jgi:hypothetical protein
MYLFELGGTSDLILRSSGTWSIETNKKSSIWIWWIVFSNYYYLSEGFWLFHPLAPALNMLNLMLVTILHTVFEKHTDARPHWPSCSFYGGELCPYWLIQYSYSNSQVVVYVDCGGKRQWDC